VGGCTASNGDSDGVMLGTLYGDEGASKSALAERRACLEGHDKVRCGREDFFERSHRLARKATETNGRQTNKQTNKRTNERTNKQTNKRLADRPAD
jgi:hypothetical protein